ncbi:MAG: YARHG domain-containing protein [Candidatus Lindowbacteria bacterium]|nr:YARHG domain-containing protein [Candidatus Lindowbacteria bacterium]
MKLVKESSIKAIIAEILYYELFARNKYPFTNQGWERYFESYMYHGGWYNPSSGFSGKSFLSPIEQKNATFLKTFIKNDFISGYYE